MAKKLSSAIARFWWDTKNNNRGLHWASWDKLCVPFDQGGLGFRDFRDVNLALLAKQLWRLLKYPHSLLARVLKGRYYRHSNPMLVNKSSNPSFSWKSIIASKPIIRDGLRKIIGNGADTYVWLDDWIPDTPPRPAKDNGNGRDQNLRVGHLINFENKQWNLEIMRELIAEEDIPRIQSIRISPSNRRDSYSWDGTKSGLYTVKAGHAIANAQKKAGHILELLEPSTKELKKQVWKVKSVRKIKHFLWQALSGYVAAASRLVDRHCGTDRSCQRCGAASEDINHILFECPPAIQCWAISSIPTIPGVFPSSSLFSNFDFLLLRSKDYQIPTEAMEMFPWLVWYIWKARNDKIFNGRDVSPEYTVQLASHEAIAWKVAQVIPELDNEEHEPDQIQQVSRRQSQASVGLRCQVDASWVDKTSNIGLGFALMFDDHMIRSGSRRSSGTLSPLQAEIESLLWAMTEMINGQHSTMMFETDCEQLVRIIEKEEECPSLEAELDELNFLKHSFIEFKLCFIPRTLNVRADALAKSARSRVSSFSLVIPENPIGLVATSPVIQE